ncbi:MAG TPA: hypothetical protein ENI73_05315 [Spirochaetes bacterium]|nr:hypothetical protein [Spirochaetota bacterium]
MTKFSSLVKVYYPLIFGLGLIVSILFFRSALKDEMINIKLTELDQQIFYIKDKMNKLVPSPISPDTNHPFIGQLSSEFINHLQILILKGKNNILYCGERLKEDHDNYRYRDCRQSLKDKDNYYDHEMRMARNSPSQTGFDIRYSNTLSGSPEKILLFSRHFNNHDYSIRIIVSFKEIQDTLDRIDRIVWIFAFVMISILVLVNNLLSNMIVKPLQGIIRFLKDYKEDRSLRLSYTSVEEVIHLQYFLNEMAKGVQKQMSELTQRKNQVETVIKNVSEGVILLDHKLKVLLYNNGLFSLLKIIPELYDYDLFGKYYYEIIRNNPLNNMIEQSVREQTRLSQNIHLSTLENQTLEVICIPLPHKSGLVVMINDITEQYKLVEIKKSFVENASHEFKTPISIIKGYLETILKTDDISVEDQKRFLEKVLRNADRLNNLIKDLITLNKLDDSRDYFRKEPVNVLDVIESCLDILSLKAETKNIQLVNAITEDSLELMGNQELLETIFFNLIDNAITYTDHEGEVIVAFKEDGDRFVFSVIDTGIGISGNYHQRIFERFYRVDEGRSRKSGGTGLGLSIVKHAVMFHDGEVYCEANPTGKGTLFKVALPFESDAEKALASMGSIDGETNS